MLNTSKLLGAVIIAALCTTAAADDGELRITVATDKPHYRPHEPIHITVTATNLHHHDVRLDFTSSHQAGYIMDGHFDWADNRGFLPVLTHVTIPPHHHHHWRFHHPWHEYAPEVGHHTLVGYVVGYGHSPAVTFDILPPGDVNHDGAVNIADLSILADNWGSDSVEPWHHGDLNGDGRVNIADLSLIAGSWGSAVPIAQAMAMFDAFSGVVIPEPSAAALLLLGAAALRRRRPQRA